MGEFGALCDRRKLSVNVDTSMRCSRYVTVGRMNARLIGEPLEAVDCLEYLEAQVTADLRYEREVRHRMNEGYRVWAALKSVLSNKG